MNKTSIILATFNGEKYIFDQLDSINKQTHFVDEVIISDDGSTDNTRRIVLEYIEANKLINWCLIDNKYNHGVAHNFINAIKKARGDIIFLCDQDDIWETNKVEEILSHFEDKQVSCVISRINYIDANGERLNQNTIYTCKRNHNVNFDELCCVCSYLGMSAAFRKNVIDDINEEFMCLTAHDWALMVIASDLGKVKYLGEILQCYRVHDDNVSIINVGTRRENRLALILRQIEILERTKKYISNDQEKMSTIVVYYTFLCERYSWIRMKRSQFILLNIVRYKRLGYTMRNIFADIIASF